MKSATVMLLMASMLFGATVCCPPPASNTAVNVKSPELERKQLVEVIEKKTVALVEDDEGVEMPYCSGVWIGQEEILTALHCMMMTETGTVKYKTLDDADKPSKVAKIVGFDPENDLAILHVDPKTMAPHLVASVAQESWDGEHVNIVGHTTGLWWTYIEGVVSSTRVKEDSRGRPRLMLQISSPAWFGNSGGGAWNDRGELIGISSFITTKAPLMSFFIHHEHIKQIVFVARLR